MDSRKTTMNLATRCLSGVLGLAMIAGSASCDKNEDSYLGTLKVTVTVPETDPTVSAEGVTVTITNASDLAQTSAATDAAGVVEFKDLVAGSYNVSASAKGDAAGVSFNAVKSGVSVTSGSTTEIELPLEVTTSSPDLVIKEIFYSGESFDYDEWGATAMKDYFIEIFNNSSEPVSLDGLYIGDTWTPATVTAFAGTDLSILEDNSLDHNYIYLCAAIRVPEGSNITLAPGKSFVLAMNAINFREEYRNAAIEMGSTPDEEKLKHIIDLSVADMESYTVKWLTDQGLDASYAESFDLDNPHVPNAENIYLTPDIRLAFYWDNNGASPVIFRSDKTFGNDDIITYRYTSNGDPQEVALLKVPVNSVIDGADFVGTAEDGKWKRLPNLIDKGFNYVPGGDNSNTNYSQRRKIDEEATKAAGRLILMDTNNTSADFEAVEPPTPKGGYVGYEL